MTAAAPPVATAARSSAVAAYRLLWLAVAFDVLAFGVGAGWDRRWHATHPFEDFFSPPHIFAYSMHGCATLTLTYIAFTPELRRWFGDAFAPPPFPFPMGPGGVTGSAQQSQAPPPSHVTAPVVAPPRTGGTSTTTATSTAPGPSQ